MKRSSGKRIKFGEAGKTLPRRLGVPIPSSALSSGKAFRDINKRPKEGLNSKEMAKILFTPEFRAVADKILGEYSFQEAGELFRKNLALYVFLSKGKRNVGDTATALVVTRQHIYHLLPEWALAMKKKKPRSKQD